MPGVTSLAEPTTVGALEAFAYKNLGVVRLDDQLNRTIHQVEQDELLRAAETLHKCFSHDPVINYLIDPTKDDEKKESLHRRYFQVFSNLAYLRGYLHQVNDFSGVILWFPPNATRQSSPLHLIRAGFVQVFRHVGLHGLRRFFVEYLPLGDQSRSRVLGLRAKYYHIFFMGVLPRFQHTDLAARLLEHVVHLADTDRLPCLVECALEEQLMLYEQFGFRVWDVQHLGKGDARIPMWTLVRQPGGHMPQAQRPGVVVAGSQSVYSPNHSLNSYHLTRTSERHSTDQRQSQFAFDSFASEPAPVAERADAARTSPKPSLKKRASLFGLISLKPWRRSATRSREPNATSSSQRTTITSTASAHTAPTPSTASSRIFSTLDARPNFAGYAPTYWSRPSDASVNTIQPLCYDDPMRRGRSSKQLDRHYPPSTQSSTYPTPLVAPDATIGLDICVDPLTLNKPLPQPKECLPPEYHNRLSYPSTRTRDSVISAGVTTTATSSTLLTPLSSDASSHEDRRGSQLVDPLLLPPFCPLPPIPAQPSSPTTQDKPK
ncbi:hypothetical protein H4R35_002457 [Dimargaris xerosporica]|nr:hypothetical protein H4R35_002457 [Dimargaris xerosporica]